MEASWPIWLMECPEQMLGEHIGIVYLASNRVHEVQDSPLQHQLLIVYNDVSCLINGRRLSSSWLRVRSRPGAKTA